MKEETEIPKNATHISYSEFSKFQQCPHLHLIMYYLKLDKEPPSIHLYFGDAIHSALERTLKEDIDVKERIRHFRYVFKKHMMDKMRDTPEFKDTEDFLDQGQNILETLSIDDILKDYEVVSVEEKLYENLYKNFYFKGFIDLVLKHKKSSKYKIIDWKTSSEAWKLQYKLSDEVFQAQMRFYKYFWARKNNIALDEIDCQYIVLNRLKNKKNPMGKYGEPQYIGIESTQTEIKQSLEKLSASIKMIHITRQFDKVKHFGNEKRGCMFCKFKGNCHPLCNSQYEQYKQLLKQHKVA